MNNIEDTKIHCYTDREENLWFAIDYTGIYLKREDSKPFFNLSKNPHPGLGISHNIVKSILLDKQGNLWIGTDGGGLNLKKKNNSTIKYFH